MSVELRTFLPSDVAFAHGLTMAEGWDTPRALFTLLIEHAPEGCFIAESEGRAVGMVTTTRHASTGWIGNVIVVPEHRGRGIGRRLMEVAMRHLGEGGCGRLVLEADPAGVPLYRALGFRDLYDVPRWVRPADAPDPVKAVPVSESEHRIVPLDDVDAVADLDRAHFGDDRSRVLARLLTFARRAVMVVDGEGVCAGYGMTWPSEVGMRIGPCLARSAGVAELVFRDLLRDANGRGVIAALPATNVDGAKMYRSLGFVRRASCLRMAHDSGDPGARPGSDVGDDAAVQFAIGNGATG